MTRSPALLKMGPQEAVIREMENDQLWESIEAMPDRERRVLVRRHGLDDREPANLAELAAELSMSLDRVRRLQSNLERQLRKQSTPWPGKFKITRFSDFVSVFPDKENARARCLMERGKGNEENLPGSLQSLRGESEEIYRERRSDMPQAQVTMDVRKVSDDVSVIDVKGELTAFAEGVLMDAYG